MSKLVLLQVLRALAALAVAVLHAQHDAGTIAQRAGLAFTPSTLLPWTAGVDLFFVISGFVMVYASQGLFAQAGAARLFLARRLARIVPLYWATTTLYLGLAMAVPALLNSERLEPGFVLASYLFWPVARPDGLVQPLYSLGWTLNYEMLFYALFAVAILRPLRPAVLGLAGALGLLAVGGLLLAPLPQPLAFWTDPIVIEFAFGLGLGLAWVRGVRLDGRLRAALALAGLILLGLDGAATLPRALAHGLPAALIVAAAVLGRPAVFEGGGLGGGLARAAAALGDASYALYLLHPFAIRGAREVVLGSGLAPVIGPWGFVALALLLATALALLVHRTFERPATQAVRRMLRA